MDMVDGGLWRGENNPYLVTKILEICGGLS